MTSPSRSRLQTGVRIVLFTTVALIALAVGAALLPPSWWSPTEREDELTAARASSFEQQLTARIHEIRENSAPWGFRVTQEQVNEWLSTRLAMWIEHDEKLNWPKGIDTLQVRFGDGEVEVAGRGSGPVWRVWFDATLEGGTCRLVPTGAGLGRLPFGGVVMKELAGMVPEGVLQKNGEIEMPARMTLVDGRTVQVVDFELVDGAIGILLETHPSGDSSQEAPAEASWGDDPDGHAQR